MKSKWVSVIVGLVFVIFGLVLLASLVNIIKAADVFGFVWPWIFIFVGLDVVSGKDQTKNKVGIGLALLTIGVLELLVRVGVISQNSSSLLIGIALLVGGTIILTRIVEKSSKQNDKTE